MKLRRKLAKVTETVIDRPANLSERVGYLIGEMYNRAEDYDLQYRDDLAVRSAVTKAAVAGWQAALAEVAHIAHEQGAVFEVRYGPECEHDPYADEFGNDPVTIDA